MRSNTMGFMMLSLTSILLFSGTSFAANLEPAKNTVINIQQSQPPQVSTTTKPSPVGQPVNQPKGPSVHAKEPPSPVNKLNPQNDPDVARGLKGASKY